MSDLEEMDSERLNELESLLYASIHYNDGGVEPFAAAAVDAPGKQPQLDAQTMPPPQPQMDRLVSDKRVINNKPLRAPKPRYWAEPATTTTTGFKPATAATTTSPSFTASSKDKDNDIVAKSMPPPAIKRPLPSPKSKKVALNSPSPSPKKNQTKPQQLPQQPKKQQQQQQQQQQQVQKPKKESSKREPEAEPFDQRLLVAIPSGPPPAQPRGKRETAASNAPFAKASRKLEQLRRMAEKKQKSKQARANRKQQLLKQPQPALEFIDLACDSDQSSDVDDVIHVPLPPPPIIKVDTSEEEEEPDEQVKLEPQAYIEENANHAADVRFGQLINLPEEAADLMTPPLYSPCNSVISSDDFIVPKDKSRLLAERARAIDEDLLVLTENAMKANAEAEEEDEDEQENDEVEVELAEEQQVESVDTSSEHEFVPPSRLEEIKQNYRVDEQQFRALDVYESESDLAESGGIYSRTGLKQKPTIIRSVDSSLSDSSDVEAIIEPAVNKMKRLRKRRSSSTNQSQSEPNNEDEQEETDSEDGVEGTGVPGIARGMAVERCKRKIRRRNSESVVSVSVRRSSQLEVVDEASMDSVEEIEQPLPSARDIAERLLQQQQQQVETNRGGGGGAEEQQLETVSIGSDADTADEAELNDAISDRISAVFERIDAHAREARRKQQEMEDNFNYVQEDAEVPEIINDDSQPSVEAIEEINAQELQGADEVEEVDAMSDVFDIDYSSTMTTTKEPELDPVQEQQHSLTELEDVSPQSSGGDLVGWNEEMCRFYNDSWNGENFNVRKLQKGMNPHRQHWKINNEDRFPVIRQRSKQKCTNCYEMGHMRFKCPRPRKPIVCSTCGQTGHLEPRCPNAICLGCGAKQSLYVQKCNKCSFQSRMVCQLCKMRGHCTNYCPDKWRRYHSTTRPNTVLESSVEYRAKQCSYCAARGHLFENCRQRIGEYRSTNFTSTIISHQKVYKDRKGPVGSLADLSSFFELATPFHFEWSEKTTKSSYYARFLREVGLGHILRSKRKAPEMLQAVQQQLYAHEYVPNPQARAAGGQGQVQNQSRSSVVIFEEAPALVQQKEISSNFLGNLAAAIASKRAKPSATITKAISHDQLDSDSNYSFSEHFELPSSTTNERIEMGSGPMDNLPEMIPLSRDDNEEEQQQPNIRIISQALPSTAGISMCVNNKAPLSRNNNNNDDESSQEMPEVPSEGKIILARDQTEYLFSSEGREFLTASAKKCKVDVRLDFKEYGYVLVIYGLKKDQEELQITLLRRNQDVKRKTSEFQGQKPPKRVDVLIRFLRDGINSLNSHLGSAEQLYERIKQLEQMNTKNGYKTAERKRRLLNMILVGQAGLLNGKMHLDQLLLILKTLVQQNSPDENASLALRTEIEEHWRMIFTAYPHPDYEKLLSSYGQLVLKNQLPQMNIDPALLGRMSLGGSVAKRESLPPPPPPVWMHETPPPPPSMQAASQSPKNRPAKQRPASNNAKATQGAGAGGGAAQQQQPNRRAQLHMQPPPCHNPLQRSRSQLQLAATLLEAMDGNDSRSSINTDAKKPSMFWSRESFKYLDDMFKMRPNPDTLERLQRVRERSRRGLLSHNDYRAVIRLHSLMQSN